MEERSRGAMLDEPHADHQFVIRALAETLQFRPQLQRLVGTLRKENSYSPPRPGNRSRHFQRGKWQSRDSIVSTPQVLHFARSTSWALAPDKATSLAPAEKHQCGRCLLQPSVCRNPSTCTASLRRGAQPEPQRGKGNKGKGQGKALTLLDDVGHPLATCSSRSLARSHFEDFGCCAQRCELHSSAVRRKYPGSSTLDAPHWKQARTLGDPQSAAGTFTASASMPTTSCEASPATSPTSSRSQPELLTNIAAHSTTSSPAFNCVPTATPLNDEIAIGSTHPLTTSKLRGPADADMESSSPLTPDYNILFSGPPREESIQRYIHALDSTAPASMLDLAQAIPVNIACEWTWATYLHRLTSGLVLAAHYAPPCDTFANSRRGSGPRPLRSADGPGRYGLRGLTPGERANLQMDILLALRIAEALRIHLRLGILSRTRHHGHSLSNTSPW